MKMVIFNKFLNFINNKINNINKINFDFIFNIIFNFIKIVI